MKELVFLLEEESARAMLEGLLPRMLHASIHVRFITFEGKQDLEKQLAKRIRGYLNPQARFLVLRDQDSAPDCVVVKRKLLMLCEGAGRQAVSLVRIACRELESMYLADLQALEQALSLKGLARQQGNTKFRNLNSPTINRRSRWRYFWSSNRNKNILRSYDENKRKIK